MNPPEENKNRSGRTQSESDEASLNREKTRASALKNYVVTDGEFTSFPEV